VTNGTLGVARVLALHSENLKKTLKRRLLPGYGIATRFMPDFEPAENSSSAT